MAHRTFARGFTLIEILFAMAVLMAGVIAAASLSTMAARAVMVSRTATTTALLATEKLEQLRSLTWAFDSAGQRLADTSTDVTVTPAAPESGVGLTPSPVDSLARNVAGYVDFLDASARWMRGGPDPPAGALYVRRWSIVPVVADPVDSLSLRVVVLRKRGAVGDPLRLLPGDTSLATVKTRKAP